ncbi:MAG: sulfatase-like hydrolase/transferase, partial [Bacteroidetes bacterium]|nr:sulfatase-like hydrolase/transferase [Bacteroidota bacterium]
ELVKYLSVTGYTIVNYSIFDLAGNPSPIDQDFLPTKARLITDRTLWGRIKKEILWNFLSGKLEIKWLTKNGEFYFNKNNQLLIDLLKKESGRTSPSPRFIYAHYNMPHPPYYFDQNGKANPIAQLAHAYDKDKALYLGYVGYTNTKIKELVTTIMTNSKGRAVIIIMGDHGFRNDNSMPQHVFLQNQNAIYLPDKNYTLFYDSITGVNQFRVLCNTLFKQKIAILKDSTSFLRDIK